MVRRKLHLQCQRYDIGYELHALSLRGGRNLVYQFRLQRYDGGQ